MGNSVTSTCSRNVFDNNCFARMVVALLNCLSRGDIAQGFFPKLVISLRSSSPSNKWHVVRSQSAENAVCQGAEVIPGSGAPVPVNVSRIRCQADVCVSGSLGRHAAYQDDWPADPSLREKVISHQFESLLQQSRICHLPFPFFSWRLLYRSRCTIFSQCILRLV